MRYKTLLFDSPALMADAPLDALKAQGAACVCAASPGDADALFVSADPRSVEAAHEAGAHCALALWRGVPARHVRATHYLRSPGDLLNLLDRREAPFDGLYWLQAAREMQFIAQAGLAYSRDPYDLERFERLRDLAAEMLARGSGLPLERVREVFLCEKGYQTPKVDTRAAIVEDGRILLVREKSGRWALPGGWMDVDTTLAQNTAKEALEEAGLRVLPRRVVALLSHNLHNTPVVAQGVIKIFVLCERLCGSFQQNIETVESRFFSADALPELATGKTTAAQVRMCLCAAADERWQPVFD